MPETPVFFVMGLARVAGVWLGQRITDDHP
jgi:hypothetical protein